MISPVPGLHHFTAMALDPQRNLDLCTQVLGLRFAKRTVNFNAFWFEPRRNRTEARLQPITLHWAKASQAEVNEASL